MNNYIKKVSDVGRGLLYATGITAMVGMGCSASGDYLTNFRLTDSFINELNLTEAWNLPREKLRGQPVSLHVSDNFDMIMVELCLVDKNGVSIKALQSRDDLPEGGYIDGKVDKVWLSDRVEEGRYDWAIRRHYDSQHNREDATLRAIGQRLDKIGRSGVRTIGLNWRPRHR